MPRVLIIERTRHPRSGKKTFKQTIEFVSARSLPRRLKRLQKNGGAIVQRGFSRSKKNRRLTPFF
jgi:DNA-binding HxlR family transcriptional regulator